MLTVLIERHLRHKRRIPGSLHKRTTHYDIASVIFAIIGSLGLIFLSIFDAFNYSNVHWSMTVVFIIFVALSVIFQVSRSFCVF
jgi:Frag1/DRAM/Sfk1 family